MTKILQVITVVFVLFILWIVYSADTGLNNIFFDFVDWLPYGDKIGYFFLFGVLTLFLNLTLRFKRLKFWRKLPLGTFLVTIFVIIEEFSQAFFPNRTLDIADIIADGLGILTFTMIGYLLFENGKFGLKKIRLK